MAPLTKKQFPGFGKPIKFLPQETLPSALNHQWISGGITLREQRMMRFIDNITDKPGWEYKVFDDQIVAKWRAEAGIGADGAAAENDNAHRDRDVDVAALGHVAVDDPDNNHRIPPHLLYPDVFMSSDMFDFCISELRDKSARFKETGQVNIYDAELIIVKSDTAISNELQDQLRAAVKPLEDVPDRQKDWHPGSDETVLDLVHPSLFPVIWGVTRALEEGSVPLDGCETYIGKGKTVDPYNAKLEGETRWGDYQWLPAEVSYNNGEAKITSYINNLRPSQHKALYSILERITTATIPLWQDAIKGFNDRRRIRFDNAGEDDWVFPKGLKYQIPGRDGPGSQYDPSTGEVDYDGERPEDENDDDWRDLDEDYDLWKRENRVLVYRDPREYIPQAKLTLGPKDLSGQPMQRGPVLAEVGGLQVIYKLANIHLTPEKPEYPGGTWHVEGTLNESIVASAIYYYDQHNITNSHLAFRQSLDAEEIIMIPEQDEYESLEAYLGIHQDGPQVQHLGSVKTCEGRLIVFPNVIQHQVQPFELVDKTRPGHRKILAMFLVDPYREILSSAHVPPQRRDWWADEVRRGGSLEALPNELFNFTVDLVDDFPLSWEQAVKHREILMEGRSAYVDQQSNQMFEERFSFCEH